MEQISRIGMDTSKHIFQLHGVNTAEEPVLRKKLRRKEMFASLERIQADESLPALARELFAAQAEEYAQLQAQIDKVDARLIAWHRADECSRRLTKIPGVGPIGAVLLTMKTPEPELFRSGRQFAAWIGLTPKDRSTAGKVRLGGITRAGDERCYATLTLEIATDA
jgi:transposase